jgi:hypothetical protein
VESDCKSEIKKDVSGAKNELNKSIRLLKVDFNAEISKMEDDNKVIMEMVRELGTAYQAELVKLGTKFTIAVSVFTLVATVVMEVIFGHLLKSLFE